MFRFSFGYNWDRLSWLCCSQISGQSLGTGHNAEHWARGSGPCESHGLIDTICFSTSTTTCLDRASRARGVSSEVLTSCRAPLQPLQNPSRCRAPGFALEPDPAGPAPAWAQGQNQSISGSVRAPRHRSLPHFSFFSLQDQHSPPVVVCCSQTLREEESGRVRVKQLSTRFKYLGNALSCLQKDLGVSAMSR